MSSIIPSRHLAKRRAQPSRRLVVFRIRQEWFALPIQFVHKVIPLGQLYGVSSITGTSLTLYNDRELLVIDPEYRIFGQRAEPKLLRGTISMQHGAEGDSTSAQHFMEAEGTGVQRYLLLVQSLSAELTGMSLDEQPALRTVPDSAFAPVPPAYLAEGMIQCVSALVHPAPDQPFFFLLNPDQLLRSAPALLPNS